MSEWIRHRGSKGMPKCLEGKRFEVRFRDGDIADAEGVSDWTHTNSDYDVMAFRILGNINPPDYSKGFPVGTTAKDIGAKVGDKFVVVDGCDRYKTGDIVTFALDDGTTEPYFDCKGRKTCITWQFLSHVPPKTAIELQAEEVGIPEPVKEWPENRMDVIGQNGNDGLYYDAVPNNKYQRTIKGVTVDVYDVLAAFGVTCQARGHSIKKLLMAGRRGHKDEAQDLREAVQAIERSIELVGK